MILVHSICIHTLILVEIVPAVAEIWALQVFVGCSALGSSTNLHRQSNLALPLPQRLLHTNVGLNRLRTVDLYSGTDRQTDKQAGKHIELY